MSITDLIPVSLRVLPKNAVVLFVTRFTRLFAYGALSVILVFYLVSLGLTEAQVGLLLTLALAGDIGISLLLTTRADRIGRRRMLIVGPFSWLAPASPGRGRLMAEHDHLRRLGYCARLLAKSATETRRRC